MAQSVARNIGSVEVTGSIPVASFIIKYLIYISTKNRCNGHGLCAVILKWEVYNFRY